MKVHYSYLIVYFLGIILSIVAPSMPYSLLCLEISCLSLLFLMLLEGCSHESFIKSFQFNVLATTFEFLGVACLDVEFARIAANLEPLVGFLRISSSDLGAIFLIFGFLGKLSLVPFAYWWCDLVDGIEIRSTILWYIYYITLFLALSSVLNSALINVSIHWERTLIALGLSTFFLAGLLSIVQVLFRRMLSYWFLSQIGLSVFLLALSHEMDDIWIKQFVYFILIYCFFVVILGEKFADHFRKSGIKSLLIHDLRGLFYHSKYLAMFLSVICVSLTTIPFSPGFVVILGISHSSVIRYQTWYLLCVLLASLMSFVVGCHILLTSGQRVSEACEYVGKVSGSGSDKAYLIFCTLSILAMGFFWIYFL